MKDGLNKTIGEFGFLQSFSGSLNFFEVTEGSRPSSELFCQT